METFDYKPLLKAAQRRAAARFGAAGAAAHRHVGQPVVAAARRVAVRVRPARRATAPGSATCCRTPPRSSTTSASSARCTPRPSITIRRSRSSRAGRRSPGRPSMGAWVHYGLGSDNEDLPAFVVLITPGKVDQPLYARLWGSGFLPSRTPGRAVPERQGRRPVPRQPRRRDAREPPAAARSAARAARARRRAARRCAKWTRASRSTRCRTGCRRACRA